MQRAFVRLWFPFWVNTAAGWVAGSSGAAIITPKASGKLSKMKESPELHRSPATLERLQGAAAASQHLSQASLAPGHRVFPRAKFPQPLTHLIATGAAPLGELEMLLPHHKTLVETPEASRS